MNILIYGYDHLTSSIWPGSLNEQMRRDADPTKKISAPKTPKMIKSPILTIRGPRYPFLTTRKVISGQKYHRNTQKLKKSDFFAKKIFNLETLAKKPKFQSAFSQKMFEQYRSNFVCD